LGLLILSGVAAVVSVTAALLAGLSLWQVFGVWCTSIALVVAVVTLLIGSGGELGD